MKTIEDISFEVETEDGNEERISKVEIQSLMYDFLKSIENNQFVTLVSLKRLLKEMFELD